MKESNPLFHMLTYKRPFGSKSEETIVQDVLMPLKGARIDDFGNVIVRVGNDSKTLFSSHTDTVHQTHGRQKPLLDSNKNILFKDDHAPLGADDATGMWLMMQMIENEVPGLYIFHRGEECGGLGSNHIAQETPEVLNGIERAIAFDRRGTNDIITYQVGGRCASEDFAKQLSGQLNMGHSSARGSFTDTANYIDLISECTNISVGYANEHTDRETQDLNYLYRLRDALMKVEWEQLEPKRQPGEKEFFTWNNRSSFGWGQYQDMPLDSPVFYDTLEYNELYKVVILEPEVAAQLMYDAGISKNDLRDMRRSMHGLTNIVV